MVVVVFLCVFSFLFFGGIFCGGEPISNQKTLWRAQALSSGPYPQSRTEKSIEEEALEHFSCKMDVDEESVPLLGSSGVPSEKNPYLLISTHDIRVSPKREIRKSILWRIAFVAISLSVLGLLATTAQLGIQFYVTSLKSTSTPPAEETLPPIGGIIGGSKPHPPVGNMTSPRVFPVKSQTTSTEGVDSTETEETMEENESSPNNNKITSKSETKGEEEFSTTIATDTVVMPGSPSDPMLDIQRGKKNSVLSTIGTIPAGAQSTTTIPKDE